MRKNIIKGAIAGVIGGIVATKLKSSLEEVLPVREESTDSPPVVIANRIVAMNNDIGIQNNQKKSIEEKIHWTFGLITGALYGIAVEKNKKAATGFGSSMGSALYSTTHASMLPALKTEPWPIDNKNNFVANEFIGHVAFGMTTEIVRRIVRKILN